MQDSDDPNENVFAPAYIRPIYDGGGNLFNNTSDARFRLNLDHANVIDQLSSFQSSCFRDGLTDPGECVERDDFWVVYVQMGYQPSTSEDHDPDNTEGAESGFTRAFELTDDCRLHRIL